MTVKSVVEDGYYIALTPDGTEIGRRAKRDKCLEDISAYGDEHCIYGEYRIRQPEVKVTLGAAKFSHGLVIPTPDGRCDIAFPNGDDGGASAPSIPVLTQPVVISDTEIDVSLHTLSTGGSAPITYVLERSISGANSWSVIASGTDVFSGEDGYADTVLSPDTQYDYRVKAVGADSRESGYSEIVTARTLAAPDPTPELPAKITGLAVETIGETTIEGITWNADANATSYRVAAGLWEFVEGTETAIPDTLFLDTTSIDPAYPLISGLDPEQKVYLRITGLNAAGSGEKSDRLFLTTLAEPVDPDEPVSSDILFGPWTHDSEPIGVAQTVAGVWAKSNNPTNPAGGTTWDITDQNPMIPGKKYYRTVLNKNNGSSHYRTERSLSSSSDPMRASNFIDLGNDLWKASQKCWYGILIRIDDVTDGGTTPNGFYIQWHSPNTVGQTSSPVIAVRGRQGGLAVYRKGRENNASSGVYTNNYGDTFLQNNQWKGVTHAYIFEIFWDNRTAAQGSEGITRLYLNDNPTPVWTYDGQRNVTYGVEECGSSTHHPFVKIGLYAAGSHTGIFTQSHTNMVVMGANGSRLGMLDALDYGNAL